MIFASGYVLYPLSLSSPSLCTYHVIQQSSNSVPLHRTGRQTHYPDELVGALDPYILLVHQGMVEDVLIKDLAEHGVSVDRGSPFVSCVQNEEDVDIVCSDITTGTNDKYVKASYLVGCDGSRSMVRPYVPNAQLEGKLTSASWGVLDGMYLCATCS